MEITLVIRSDEDARKALDLLTEYLAKDWLPAANQARPDPSMDLFDFGIRVRALNLLRSANIETLGDLLKWTPERLLAIPQFGKACLADVQHALSQKGVGLATAC